MKSITVLAIMLMLISCAVTQPSEPLALNPQELKITVSSATDSKVDIDKGDGIQRTMGVPNPEGTLSQLSFIANNKAFIKVFSGLSVADVTRLWNDICVLENTTEIKDINLFLNSPGGDAFSGLALADEIERAQRKGFNITAHASGIIASAAVPVLAVCNKRLAASGTIFMVHEAALWKWPGQETASDIRAQNELMDLLKTRYLNKLSSKTKLTKDQWEELEKKTTWFDAEKALEWGLVDSIE